MKKYKIFVRKLEEYLISFILLCLYSITLIVTINIMMDCNENINYKFCLKFK
jgi:hypothetical protein